MNNVKNLSLMLSSLIEQHETERARIKSKEII
jgi:hypothetical protein